MNFQKNYEFINSRKSLAHNNNNTRQNELSSNNNYDYTQSNYKALPEGYKARR